MKIVRFLTEDGEVRMGSIDEDRPGEARIVRGDLFGRLEPTEQRARIRRLLAPLTPCNILAVGLNYGGHAAETKISRPESPVLFLKATTSVIGPGDVILLPSVGPDRVDYEAELAVVIGRRAKNVSRQEALDVVLGYPCANDVSARDWQFEWGGGQFCRGKSFDSFCPLGPCLLTADEVPDPSALRLRTDLNGITVQESGLADLIFSVPRLISFLSAGTTLLPGTVILTGTPQGVGHAAQPPRYLRPGDTVAVHVEGIGTLVNPVLADSTDPMA